MSVPQYVFFFKSKNGDLLAVLAGGSTAANAAFIASLPNYPQLTQKAGDWVLNSYGERVGETYLLELKKLNIPVPSLK